MINRFLEVERLKYYYRFNLKQSELHIFNSMTLGQSCSLWTIIGYQQSLLQISNVPIIVSGQYWSPPAAGAGVYHNTVHVYRVYSGTVPVSGGGVLFFGSVHHQYLSVIVSEHTHDTSVQKYLRVPRKLFHDGISANHQVILT